MKKPQRPPVKRAPHRDTEARNRASLEFQRPDQPRDNGRRPNGRRTESRLVHRGR